MKLSQFIQLQFSVIKLIKNAADKLALYAEKPGKTHRFIIIFDHSVILTKLLKEVAWLVQR